MTQATQTPAAAAPDTAAALEAEYAQIVSVIDRIKGLPRLVLEGRLVELEREYDRLTAAEAGPL